MGNTVTAVAGILGGAETIAATVCWMVPTAVGSKALGVEATCSCVWYGEGEVSHKDGVPSI